jgi:methylated-DNA-protein-cysteine methyltransferase related protein
MSKFSEKVIQAVRLIPKGKVASYGQIALMVGVPRAALQVGWVLHQSGEDGITPWWRVINNAGRISTSCEEHTAWMQKQLLQDEGVLVDDKLNINIEKFRYIPNENTLKKLELPGEYAVMLKDRYGV